MRSFTSSSDERLPSARWGRIWAGALALVVPFLAMYEGFWRWRGFVPSVDDNVALWIATRSTVRPHDYEQIVLIGASRMQLDVDPETFAESFDGRRPVQLAVNGSVCTPVLEHFAQEKDFSGIVVCDLVDGILSGRSHLTFPHLQAEYVRQYQARSAVAVPEERLRLLLQANTVSRMSPLSPRSLLAQMAKGQWPLPSATVILPDRSGRMDATRVSMPPSSPAPSQIRVDDEQVRRTVDHFGDLVESIRSRGGEVIFVRLPSSGQSLRTERIEFPQSREWDVLACQNWALTIHFAHHPSLAHFECPDGSHLAFREGVQFTKALVRIVREKLNARKPTVTH